MQDTVWLAHPAESNARNLYLHFVLLTCIDRTDISVCGITRAYETCRTTCGCDTCRIHRSHLSGISVLSLRHINADIKAYQCL
jgi:hypothetical protein